MATVVSAPSRPREFDRQSFSLAEARRIISDLFDPNPRIYWTDFLVSWTAGVICFDLVRRVPLFSPLQLVLFVASCILYYRSALFIHEIVHRRHGSFRNFSIVWHL